MLIVENLAQAYLVFGPYVAFVFFGESFNPFSKPKTHPKRSNWKYGRTMGTAVLLGNLCALSFMRFDDVPLLTALSYGAVVSAILVTLFSMKRLNKRFRQ